MGRTQVTNTNNQRAQQINEECQFPKMKPSFWEFRRKTLAKNGKVSSGIDKAPDTTTKTPFSDKPPCRNNSLY